MMRTPHEARAESPVLAGTSAAVRALRVALDFLAPSHVDLFLSGEPGAGKREWVEALAHRAASGNAPVPVLRLNGKADEQVEAVFFPSNGGGTFPPGTIVYLEAPDALPREMQLKLAARLQRPGPHALRVIAATDEDPDDLVRRGRLAATLHGALGVVHVRVPPLRDRRQDIDAIATQWIATRNRTNGSTPPLPPDVVAVLAEHPWPGNVRELLAVLAVATAAHPGEPPSVDRIRAALGARTRDSRGPDVRPLARVEADYITTALERCGGNRALTARRLGIGRSTLIRKLKTLGFATAEGLVRRAQRRRRNVRNGRRREA
jgi:DNA-binding NtrC family response regulator